MTKRLPQPILRLLAVALSVSVIGCAPRACAPMLSAELLLGAPDTDAAFQAFLDRSVTPRFPAGLTVWDAAGRWRSKDGQMTQQSSKVLLIVTEAGPDTKARLEAIRQEYKTEFHQQSVGLLLFPACASF